MFRDAPGDSLHEIAVRIEEGDAFAILDVLANHRFHQRRFASSGLPDNVHSRAPIRPFNPKNFSVIPKICLGKSRDAVVCVHPRIMPRGN